MKDRLTVISVLFVGIWSLLAFIGPAIAGTVDLAELSPANATIAVGSSQAYTFSAVNNNTLALKEYSAILKYDAGVDITNLAVSPAAATASINAAKKQIVLKWVAVSPGIELKASFSASAEAGTYHISPFAISYQVDSKKRYTVTCNTATLVVASQPISAEPPINFRSISGDGFITIEWGNYAADPIVGYVIYRRTSSTQYVRLNDTPVNYRYKDTSVQNNVTYYYGVYAIDASGNESALLAETAETYFDLRKMIINKSGAAVAAVGDINGDSKPDIAIGLPNAVIGTHKSAVQCGAVEIYFGGNTTSVADVTLWGEHLGDSFGSSLTIVDLNNDGYDDLVIGAPQYDPTTYWPISGQAPQGGKIYIYEGGPLFSTSPVKTIDGDWSYDNNGSYYYIFISEKFGYSMAAVGDINGDGFNDVAIGAPWGGMGRSGSVFIFYGNIALNGGRFEIRGPDYWQLMGMSIASSGDVDRDGHSDILTCGYDPASQSPVGKIYVYGGSSSQGYPMVLQGDCRHTEMLDINGDGYADMAASTGKGVDIYYGGRQVDTFPSFTFYQNPHVSADGYITSIGDLNNDMHDDLLGDGPTVFFGNSEAENVPDIERTGFSGIGAGDIDNDGLKEAFVTDSNNVYIYSFAPYMTLPNVEIYSPKGGAVITSSTVIIQGRVQEGAKSLRVGGIPVALSTDGSFTTTHMLHDGNNLFEVAAETSDGKISKRTLRVLHIDVSPLEVLIASPATGAVLNDSPVIVSGTVSSSLATVNVNGIQATVSGTTFSAQDVPLQEGENTITAYAVDEYNQTATDMANITLITKGSIAGAITDATNNVLLPGVTVSETDSGGSQTVMTDSEGKYRIEGVSNGAFTAFFSKSGYLTNTQNGNVAAGQTITLDVQLTPVPHLSLIIDSPQNGAVLSSSSITVTGNVSNNANVTINGIQATLTDNTFTASVPLNEGENVITASAEDQYGQTTTQSITVTLLTKGTVAGTVTDSLSGHPLPSAAVSMTDSSNRTQSVVTGVDGKYTVTGIAAGTFSGRITKDGYEAYNLAGTVSTGQTVTINAVLQPILPTIINVAAGSITYNSATITWITDQPSDGGIEYGTTASYGTSATDATVTKNHSITLINLSPGTTYHFKCTSTNSYGHSASSEDNTFTTLSPITITITSPSDGTTISGPDVMVRGTVSNSIGNETGVSVNGMVANIYGNQFVVNHVSLTEGLNTITVTGIDTAGHAGSASITLNAVTTGNYIRLTSGADSGIAPLEVILRIEGSFSIENSSISVDDATGIEWLSVSTDEYKIRLNAEGIYSFTASVTGPDELNYQDTIAITVMNKTQLDNLLKAKWFQMKSHLASQDVQGALNYYVDDSKQLYNGIYTAFYDQLPQLAQEMQDIQLIYAKNNAAKYRLREDELYGGKTETVTYYIYFVLDKDGLWKIYRY